MCESIVLRVVEFEAASRSHLVYALQGRRRMGSLYIRPRRNISMAKLGWSIKLGHTRYPSRSLSRRAASANV